MIIKIVTIAIICIFITFVLKNYNREFATIISICGGVIIFLLLVDELENVLEYFFSLYDMTGMNFDFLSTILKIIGVGYVVEFTADIAEDFDNKTIASKVVLGGKVVICGMMLPIIKNMLSLLLSLFS